MDVPQSARDQAGVVITNKTARLQAAASSAMINKFGKTKKQAKKSRPPTLVYAAQVTDFRALVEKLTGLSAADTHQQPAYFSGSGDHAATTPFPWLPTSPPPFNSLESLLLRLNHSKTCFQTPGQFPPASLNSTHQLPVLSSPSDMQLVSSPLPSHVSRSMLSQDPVQLVQSPSNHPYSISQHQPSLKHSDFSSCPQYSSSNRLNTVDPPHPRRLSLSSNSFPFSLSPAEAYASTERLPS